MKNNLVTNKVVILCLSFLATISTSSPLGATEVEDKTSQRIKGVANFLLDRANDNFMYLLESRIKRNTLLRCYFPNTYKYISTGDFISLLRSDSSVWDKSVENDIRSISELILNKIQYKIELARGDLNNKYLNIIGKLYIKIDDKYYPAFSKAKTTAEQNIKDDLKTSTSFNMLKALEKQIQELSLQKAKQMPLLMPVQERRNDCADRQARGHTPRLRVFYNKQSLARMEKIAGELKENKAAVISVENKDILLNNIRMLNESLTNDKNQTREGFNRDVRYIEQTIDKYKRLEKTLNKIEAIKKSNKEIFGVLKKNLLRHDYKSNPVSGIPYRLYYKSVAAGVIKYEAAEDVVNEIVIFIQSYQNLENYLNFVKRELFRLENSNSSFLMKIRATEEIFLCGASDRIPATIDKQLLNCKENERTQVFNLDFNNKGYWQFRRYIIFFAEVADADSAEKVETLLSDLTLPPVSYGLKRNYGGRRITISAYLGFSHSWEVTTDKSGKQVSGIFAPIGLEYTFLKWSQRSLSVMVSPFDFAHPVNLEIEGKDEAVTMGDIVVPGIYLIYGWKNQPFATGIGYSQGRAIRGDSEVEERYSVFIAVDMPLL